MMKCLPCQPHIFDPNQKTSVTEANIVCKAISSSLLLLMIDFTPVIRTFLLGLILKLLKLQMFRVEVDLRHKRAFEDMHFSYAFLFSILHCSIGFFLISRVRKWVLVRDSLDFPKFLSYYGKCYFSSTPFFLSAQPPLSRRSTSSFSSSVRAYWIIALHFFISLYFQQCSHLPAILTSLLFSTIHFFFLLHFHWEYFISRTTFKLLLLFYCNSCLLFRVCVRLVSPVSVISFIIGFNGCECEWKVSNYKCEKGCIFCSLQHSRKCI